ncbi:MAG: hypothetical protein J6R42_04485, partial [Clostridia bacterium]|nr:hypothetical protein [Clostridia bacterium]
MLFISEKNQIVIDVTKPPYNADNTGTVDCTDILCKILDDVLKREIEAVKETRQMLLDDPRDNFRIGFENRKINGVPTVIFPENPPPARIIYFPAGTYLISDTITYSWEDLVNLVDDKPNCDLNRFIRFKGEGMDCVTIRVKDNCRAFRYGEKRPMVSFVRSRFSNVNMMNSFEDLTLDTGVGTTGAIGLRFSSSNTGKVQNVTIRTSDPAHRGYAGVEVDTRHQAYMKNLHIDGFEYGIHVTNEWCVVFEDLYIKNTTRMAVLVNRGTIGIRSAVIESLGSGVRCEERGMLNMEDVVVRHIGARGGEGIRNYDAFTYLRNFTVENFSFALLNNFDTIYPHDGTYHEYTSCDRVWRLFPRAEDSLFLPVETQPA